MGKGVETILELGTEINPRPLDLQRIYYHCPSPSAHDVSCHTFCPYYNPFSFVFSSHLNLALYSFLTHSFLLPRFTPHPIFHEK